MTALIRTAMQLFIARLLAGPLGEWAHTLMDLSGITAERLADWLTVVVLGLGVGAARLLRSNQWGARLVEWANLVISWGRSAAGPDYQPKHLRG